MATFSDPNDETQSQICACFENVQNPKFNYKFDSVIRDNSPNKVYKIKNYKTNEYFVLKLVPQRSILDKYIITREYEVIKRFKQKNILKVYECSILASCDNGVCKLPIKICSNNDGIQYQNCIAMVFEYCDGPDLAAKIEEKNLTLLEKEQIALFITKAIALIQSVGVLHRDIKPGNIFFKTFNLDCMDESEKQEIYTINIKDGTCTLKVVETILIAGGYIPVLGDFGVSKSIYSKNDNMQTTQEHTNQPIGTYMYMAPEVLHLNPQGKREYGFKADSYSLGITLAELFYPASPSNGLSYFQWITEYRECNKNAKTCWKMLTDLDDNDVPADIKLYIWALTLYKPEERIRVNRINFAFMFPDWKNKLERYRELYLVAFDQYFGVEISEMNLIEAFKQLNKIGEAGSQNQQVIEQVLRKSGNCTESSCESNENSLNSVQNIISSAVEYNKNPALKHLMSRLIERLKLHSQFWKIQGIIGCSYWSKLVGNSTVQNFEKDREEVKELFEKCQMNTAETELSAKFKTMVDEIIKKWCINIESDLFATEVPKLSFFGFNRWLAWKIVYFLNFILPRYLPWRRLKH